MLYGAILGDIIGSPYEFDNGGWTKDFTLFGKRSMFTDDTVMTLAVAEALMNAASDAAHTMTASGISDQAQDDKHTAGNDVALVHASNTDINGSNCTLANAIAHTSTEAIEQACIRSMQYWGQRFPYAGYGARFIYWLDEENPQHYGSFGNGAAMRVAAAGWIADSLEETIRIAKATARVSHNHPEGLKAAACTAAVIFLSRKGYDMSAIREYVINEFGYDFSESLEEMRARHRHDETCMDTMPKALRAFFDGTSMEDVIRNAVSLGGDTDTIAAVAGAMGEAYFGAPEELKQECLRRIDPNLRDVLQAFELHR